MADIEFSCSACGQVLEAPEEMQGDVIECPSCNAEITIPQTEAAESVVFQPIPTVQDNSPYAEPAGNVCPECSAQLAPNAVLCIECGFHLKLGKKISTDFG